MVRNKEDCNPVYNYYSSMRTHYHFFLPFLQLRFLQLYDSEAGSAQEDEATWSIDNVTVTLWLNHSCSASVVAEDFSTDTVL